MQKSIIKCHNKISGIYAFVIITSVIKILLAGIFSSDYQNMLFYPFIGEFFNGHNPYQYYYENNLISSFPYPPAMLLIESIGYWFSLLSHNSVFLRNVLFKLPLLIIDLIGLYIITKMFPKQKNFLAVIYFSSPIILYSTYMHGQLDLIPIVFLVISIYFLTSSIPRHYSLFILFLSLSILTKQHILAVVPVILMYICKKHGIKRTLVTILSMMLSIIILCLPFMSKGFIENVLLNNEQNAITTVFIHYDNLKLCIPIVSILLIFLKVFSQRSMNKDLLMSFCGISFSVFLAFVPPMPGWYVWIVPFCCVIFVNSEITNKYINITLYLVLNFLYIIYFMFFHNTQYTDLYFIDQSLEMIKYKNSSATDICFTLLTGVMFYIIYIMYIVGINSNSLYKRRNLPFTIGISGDSASGKSTLLSIISDTLGMPNILNIEGDGDHKWERGEENWEFFTHLNPKANYLYRQAQDISQLRIGQKILRSDYDHQTGKFTSPKKIKPNKFIVVCGLHSLYLPQMRKNLDLKIFMDTDEKIKTYWKIERDSQKRGHSIEDTIKQINDRKPDYLKYILPQRNYADIIIEYFDDMIPQNVNVKKYNLDLSVKITISSAVDLEAVINKLQSYDVSINYDFSENLSMQTIVIYGRSLKEKNFDVNNIAREVISQLDEITTEEIVSKDVLEGIIQLFILVMISQKMKDDI